jgi:YidC/Oxa1 family membrane protein insertase
VNDLKKTFLAGFLVLLILLLTPYYLSLIGYETETPVSPVSGAAIVDNAQQPNVNMSAFEQTQAVVPAPSNNKPSSGLEQTLHIQSKLYDVLWSNIGGGSFIDYSLMSDGTNKYLGSYSTEGVYQDSVNVSLILNQNKACAPCVGVLYDGVSITLDSPFTLKNNSSIQNNQINFLNEQDSLLIESEFVDPRFIINKKTVFFGNNFTSKHLIEAQDIGGQLEEVYLIWDKGLRNTEKNLYDDVQTYSAAYISHNKETSDLWFAPSDITDSAEEVSVSGTIDWAAIRTKYFIAALIPENAQRASIQAVPYLFDKGSIVPSYSSAIFKAGNSLSASIYVGPLDIDYINELNTSLDRIMNFGWFIIQPFSRGVLWLLKTMHSFGLNYGIILILFAFLIRIITGPLMKKSFESSQNMQKVQPKLKKLQETYKNDSQRLNQEMVKLYKEEGVNPLGGCLPMLLQMPLLFSLFLVFRSTIEFRGAPFFGWISNLAQPDTIFYLPFNIPIYGDQVAFLPILLGVSMFLTQKMSMASMDSQQKPMMYIMSAFFFLLFNSFPSGLNLYYLVYNILNYLQQRSLKQG